MYQQTPKVLASFNPMPPPSDRYVNTLVGLPLRTQGSEKRNLINNIRFAMNVLGKGESTWVCVAEGVMRDVLLNEAVTGGRKRQITRETGPA